MRDRGEIDHNASRTEIVGCHPLRFFASKKCCFLKCSNGELSVSLTKRNQPNPGSHQIGSVTLQKRRQGKTDWEMLPCRPNSENHSHSRLHLAFAKRFREPN